MGLAHISLISLWRTMTMMECQTLRAKQISTETKRDLSLSPWPWREGMLKVSQLLTAILGRAERYLLGWQFFARTSCPLKIREEELFAASSSSLKEAIVSFAAKVWPARRSSRSCRAAAHMQLCNIKSNARTTLYTHPYTVVRLAFDMTKAAARSVMCNPPPDDSSAPLCVTHLRREDHNHAPSTPCSSVKRMQFAASDIICSAARVPRTSSCAGPCVMMCANPTYRLLHDIEKCIEVEAICEPRSIGDRHTLECGKEKRFDTSSTLLYWLFMQLPRYRLTSDVPT